MRVSNSFNFHTLAGLVTQVLRCLLSSASASSASASIGINQHKHQSESININQDLRGSISINQWKISHQFFHQFVYQFFQLFPPLFVHRFFHYIFLNCIFPNCIIPNRIFRASSKLCEFISQFTVYQYFYLPYPRHFVTLCQTGLLDFLHKFLVWS